MLGEWHLLHVTSQIWKKKKVYWLDDPKLNWIKLTILWGWFDHFQALGRSKLRVPVRWTSQMELVPGGYRYQAGTSSIWLNRAIYNVVMKALKGEVFLFIATLLRTWPWQYGELCTVFTVTQRHMPVCSKCHMFDRSQALKPKRIQSIHSSECERHLFPNPY